MSFLYDGFGGALLYARMLKFILRAERTCTKTTQQMKLSAQDMFHSKDYSAVLTVYQGC